MAIEIEHKFLLVNENWRSLVNHQVNYKQGYLTSEINNSIRIRTADQWAWINIKSATLGNQRQEY
jgi:adenylate cyclase